MSIADARRRRFTPSDVVLVAAAALGTLASPLITAFGRDATPTAFLDGGFTQLLSWIALLVGGILSLRRETQQGNGRIMLLTVVIGVVSVASLAFAHIGPLAFVADMLQFNTPALMGLLLLRWPGDRLQTTAQRVLIWTAFTIPTAIELVSDVFYDPDAHGWTTPTWWPLIMRNDAVADGLGNAAQWTQAAQLVVFLLLVVLRLRAASPPERRELAPVAVSALLSSIALGATLGEILRLWPYLSIQNLFNLSTTAIPISIVVGLAVRRISRAFAVEDLVTRGRSAEPDAVLQSMRRAVGDRRLEIATFSSTAGEYVRADGTVAVPPGPGRRSLFVASTDGSPLARLDIDARLTERPDLTGSVIDAASVALDGIRLRAELATRADDAVAVRAQLDAAIEQGDALSRLLPGGLPEKLRADPGALGRIDHAEVTVLMSDVRGYSTIAERTTPERLAKQLQDHRSAMNEVVLAEGGTIMQYVGDAVMAVFGAPFAQSDHARRALRAAAAMHAAQARVNAGWEAGGYDRFTLGIGLSTGDVAIAVLGSPERYEYTIVGDTVNLSQRLESQARPGGTTIAAAETLREAGEDGVGFVPLAPLLVKGREGAVSAYRWTVQAGVGSQR